MPFSRRSCRQLGPLPTASEVGPTPPLAVPPPPPALPLPDDSVPPDEPLALLNAPPDPLPPAAPAPLSPVPVPVPLMELPPTAPAPTFVDLGALLGSRRISNERTATTAAVAPYRSKNCRSVTAPPSSRDPSLPPPSCEHHRAPRENGHGGRLAWR